MMSHKKIEVSLGSHLRPFIKRKNHLRYIVIFISLCVAVFANDLSLADSRNSGIESNIKKIDSKTKPDVKWLIFSATQHSSARNLLIKQMHIRKSKLKTGKLYIALEDLNDDGVNEVFVYIDSYYYCGNETGCPLNIYKVENKQLKSVLTPLFINIGFPMFININKNGEQKEIGIVSNKTEGWHDILIRGNTIWKWNDSYYKYSNQTSGK
jgi:hypothetical protein